MRRRAHNLGDKMSKIKARGPYLKSVSPSEALELPFGTRRTMQRPHADYDIRPLTRVYMHPHWHLSLSHSWLRVKFSRFQMVKKERDIRFSKICLCFPALIDPRPGLCKSVSAANLRNIFVSRCFYANN